MIIANPIYDTAFKRLMENKRIAKFFIGTLIGEQIDEIALVPQEYVFHKMRPVSKKKKETVEEDGNEKVEVFSVIRYDFVATIRTDKGEHKKILIEIPHIKGKPRSILAEMLSVFEQKLFIDEKNITKEYEHSVANEIIREMLDTLRYVASDPKQRRSMEEEWWAEQDEKEYEEMRQALEAKAKELDAKAKELDAERKKSEAKDEELQALRLKLQQAGL